MQFFMKALTIGLGAVATQFAIAQQPWQKIQMPTAAQVAQTWKAPPTEYGPEPYYGLNGAVNETVIQRDLDRMKTLGYQAVTVQAGYDMPFAYLSPEYFTFFRTFVEEAKKRNMRVWIVDDAGYPSGFAGGKFTELKPELRMQALVVAQKIPAATGEPVKTTVGAATVAVTAINADDGATVTIPVTNSTIAWTAPAGHWTVMVVEHQFKTSPTRSDTNPKRVKDGTQSLEDYLDPTATMQYLAFTHEQYKKAVGDEFGKTIMGFRGDEPDYSISGLPWTPKFFERFTQIKGYDVRPFVAAFLQPRTTKLTDTQTRAKADYYDVFSQMFRDGFFKVQGDWCAANHLEYQVHLNHEEMEMDLTRSEGEFLRDMQYVQVPGIDTIWHQIWKDTISDFPRLAASASHVYGHPRAFTESFAAYRPAPDVDMARYILNEQFVRGVNLVETMYFPASSTAGAHSSSYMDGPSYPALLSYVQRMSYLMSMGRPAASVALYLPSSSMWMGDAAADTAFVSTERMLSERQIDFDIVNDDALAKDLIAGHGTLETASGNRYGTVILPNISVLSQAALDRLRAVANGGGRVLFLGRTPSLISGRTFLDAHAAKPADFSWASVASGELSPTPTPPAQPPASPPTPQIVPDAIAHAVSKAVLAPDVRLDTPSTALRYTRRQLKDADVYLFFNESAEEFSHSVTVRSAGRRVEQWDPQSGTITSVAATGRNGNMTIPLSLQPYETSVLVVR
jgi:alpha-L-rhamnosidase